MRILLTVVCFALVFHAGSARAEFDAAGSIIGGGGGLVNDPGDPCGTCPAPAGDWGMDFKDGDLWVLAESVLHHLSGCSVVETVPVVGIGNPIGMGYDSVRNLWIITDPSIDRVYQVNAAGVVVNSWPSPASGPVGAAYDPNRDLYWVSDWEIDAITSIDPDTGVPGPTIPVPAGTRISGTGYDPVTDVILYHGRDQAQSYCIAAATGELIASFPIPFGGLNNGSGAAIDATGRCWLSHYEEPTIFCVEKRSPTSTESSSWGVVKGLFR